MTIKRRYHLHAPGLIYVALALLVAFAALNSQNNLLFWVLGVMVAAILVSGLISGAMMMSLRPRRLDPGSGAVGEPLVVQYAVTNRNRLLPVFNIHIEERPADGSKSWTHLMQPARSWVMHIGPRETVHGDAVFWPTGRGEATYREVRLWTTFPFGVIKKSITISQEQHTLIYPRLYELRHGVLSSLTPAGPLGFKVSQHAGVGDDYFGLREYREGDSLRHIAWKRTAFTDELVSIERSRPSPPKLRVVLNLLKPTAQLHDDETHARELEEQAISLAASLIHAADQSGFEVGLTVQGADVPPIPMRRNRWHVAKIMAALAAIDLDADRITPRRPVGPDEDRTGLVVIHPASIDPSVGGYRDAWHLTAQQLESLTVGPIGWTPPQDEEPAPPSATTAATSESAA